MATDPAPLTQDSAAAATPLPLPEYEVYVEPAPQGLLRRLLVTYRHALGIAFGALAAHVRDFPDERRHGARYRLERAVNAVTRHFVDRDLVGLPFEVQLRRRLERLGATYVKLGQLLALRHDLLPERVTRELAQLLDRLPAIPHGRFLELVGRELGRDPFEVFDYIEAHPLGSASIGQAHRAGTRDGQAVILKLVKPGIRELLRRDLTLLAGVGRLLDRPFRRFEPRRAIKEFSYYVLREVDLELEADNAETFAANFTDHADVVFPRILREHSTRNLLCMEYLRGFKPSAPEAAELEPAARERLIETGAEAILRMLYRDGFFHADLHPANLLVLPGPRLGFIDLGQVGRFDEHLRRHLLLYYYCLVVGDAENAARYLTGIARTGPRADPQGFQRDVADISRRWRRHSSEEYSSLGRLMLESVARGVRYRMYFPVELVLMVKAIVTFESVGRMLDPRLDVASVSQRHLTEVLVGQFAPLRLVREGLHGAPELIDTLVKVPMLVTAGLRALENATTRPAENPFAGMRGTMFAGFCLVAGAILAAFEGPPLLWGALFVLGGLLALRRGK
ncbi:MAG: AarF/ABC1/UbiB kinase family protein [Thermoanaerobaculia bacterium]|nr:MAG: AarF/ABC1/UbiB kinase family protein [Thermoanaerobaculia bacterium]